MKPIQLFVVAGLLLALGIPAVAESDSPFHLSNRLRLGYDDNVYQSDGEDGRPDPEESFRIIEEIEMLVNLNLERTFLGLRYRPSIMWYSEREDEDVDFLNDLDLNFWHNFSPSLSLAINDSLRAGQLPELESDGFIVREDDDNYYNSAVATLSYALRETTRIDVSGRYILLRYSSDSPAQRENDYDSVVGGLTLRQNLASGTSLLGDLRYQTLSYPDAESNRDANTLYAGLGAEQTFSPQLIGSLRAGVENRQYDDDERFDDNTGPYGELSMTFLPSPATRLTASASHSIYESDVDSYASQNRSYLSLSLAHDFTAKLSFYVSGAFTFNEYEADYSLDGLGDADENSYLASARVSYRVNRINWLEIGYQYVELESDLVNRESYDRNRFDVGWKIQLF